jgi:hypothetical protein
MSRQKMLTYAAVAIVILIAWQMFFSSKKPVAAKVTATNLGTPSDVSGGPGSLQLTMETGSGDSPFGLHL